jgi:CheY-like chemotaxis protein
MRYDREIAIFHPINQFLLTSRIADATFRTSTSWSSEMTDFMAERLLIIDDEVGLTKVVGLVARQLGMEFRAINTSLAATEVFIDYQPDIVIIDMVMPDKDGIDVLDEIMLTGIPARIVVTTGHCKAYLRLAEGVAKFHGDEQVHFLKKPFRRIDLVELLKKITTNPVPLAAIDPGAFAGPPAHTSACPVDLVSMPTRQPHQSPPRVAM